MIINVRKAACNSGSSGYRSFGGSENGSLGVTLHGVMPARVLVSRNGRSFTIGADHERAAHTAVLYRDALRARRPAGRAGAAQGGDRALVLRRGGRPRGAAGPRPGREGRRGRLPRGATGRHRPEWI